MKKIAAICCFVLSMVVLPAHSQWRSYGWQIDYIAGVSVGYVHRDGNVNVALINNAQGQMFTRVGDLGDDSIMWGGILGLEWRCERWLFGTEFGVDWYTNAKSNTFVSPGLTGGTLVAHYDPDTTVNLIGRVGYQLFPYVMPYVRAGLETSEDELNATIGIIGPPQLTADIGGAQRIYRVIAGFGVEIPLPIFPFFTLRTEYNFHFKDKSVEANGTLSDGVTAVIADSKQQAQTIRASMIYHFK